jgi:hypothetical protein
MHLTYYLRVGFLTFLKHLVLIPSVGGTYFSQPDEQDAAIAFLCDIERRGIWKTYSIVTRLQEQRKEHR